MLRWPRWCCAFSSQAQVFISLHCVVQKSYCAMGQRLLQRPSYGCLYKGSASSARRRNRSPSAAHRTSLPSPAVTGRHGRGAYDAPSRRAASRSTARVECARKADQSMFCPFVTRAAAHVYITLGIEMPHRLRAPTFSASPSPAAAASSPRDRLYLEHGWALDAGSSHTRPCSLYIPSHR